jgi:hypothetical protein
VLIRIPLRCEPQVAPLVARRSRWIEFHEESAARLLGTASRMESYNIKMNQQGRMEAPGVGLEAFIDRSSKPFGPTEQLRMESAPGRRYAYPHAHSGIIFGMWGTPFFAPALCAVQADVARGRSVSSPWHIAGIAGCTRNLSASPPCLCDDISSCEHPWLVEAGEQSTVRWRKLFRVLGSGPNSVPFPSGCLSWKAQGRPLDVESNRSRLAIEQLEASGFWNGT